ncbi:RDD family protein [Neptunitalea lumnitzerae]|uniref:RDD family protein n=1 Tax=Neptunitalea lumnitzerae TaxID=2965509 RepID=A0ABQ5MLS9_9FLAO|nr:RDD family protein [Neptunitalea sp. Y10]GLB50261.1 RDD family protein [Neptunitalea sp. Y10]
MDNFQIETSQNVGISHNVANIVDRGLAYLLDSLIIVAYFIAAIFILSAIDIHLGTDWTLWLIISLPPSLYYLLFETFTNGRTPGKYAMKIRVVRMDGSSASFSNYFVRWILRIIDVLLTSCGAAVLSMLLSPSSQRIGDRAAKTTVITEKKQIHLHQTIHAELPEDYVPTYPQVSILTDKDVNQIKSVFSNAKINGNHNIIVALSDKLKNLLEVTPEEKPIVFIENVLKDYNYYTQQM